VPPLEFGDQRLERLHEIVLPAPVAWMPQTAAWAVVAALFLILLFWAALRLRRRWLANRYRREALAELAALEDALASAETRARALAALPGLVKRTALRAWPRAEVASLSSEAWLAFLDESFGRRDFRDGPGQLLPVLAYASPRRLAELPEEQITKLVGAVRSWIGAHRARA